MTQIGLICDGKHTFVENVHNHSSLPPFSFKLWLILWLGDEISDDIRFLLSFSVCFLLIFVRLKYCSKHFSVISRDRCLFIVKIWQNELMCVQINNVFKTFCFLLNSFPRHTRAVKENYNYSIHLSFEMNYSYFKIIRLIN